jgi:hypothetical protein
MIKNKVQEHQEHKTTTDKLQEEKFRTTDKFFDNKFYNQKGELNKRKFMKIFSSMFLTLTVLFSYVYINYVFYLNYSDKVKSYQDFLNVNNQLAIITDSVENISLVLSENYFYDNWNMNIYYGIIISCIFISATFIFYLIRKIEKKRFITEVLNNIDLAETIYFLKEQKLSDYNRYVFKLIQGASFNNLMGKFKDKEKKKFLLLTKFNDVSFEADKKDKNKFYLNIIPNAFPKIADKAVQELNKNIDKYLIKGYLLLGYSNVSTKDFDGLIEKKVGDIFIKYYSLEKLIIHIFTVGASGGGKSVLFANILNMFLKSLDEIDYLFIVDFGGIENTKMKKFIDKHKQKNYLSKKIITVNSIDNFEKILIKIQLIAKYRQITMNQSGANNYEGKKIFIKIDEINVGMSDLESSNKALKNQVLRLEVLLKEVSRLYRKYNIYLDIMGQSNLRQDNIDSAISKACQIKFGLKNEGYISDEFCKSAQEEGIRLEDMEKGEVLLFDTNTQNYCKFLSAFVGDDYLEKYHKEFKEVEPLKIDSEMYDYIEQVKTPVFEDYQKALNKQKKGASKNGIEAIDQEIKEYEEELLSNLKDLKNGKFIEETETFEFIKPEEFNNTPIKEEEPKIKIKIKEELNKFIDDLDFKFDDNELN